MPGLAIAKTNCRWSETKSIIWSEFSVLNYGEAPLGYCPTPLLVSFGVVVRLAKHLVVANRGHSTFAPGLNVIRVHFIKLPNLGLVCIVLCTFRVPPSFD